MAVNKGTRLKVAEAVQDDVNGGIVRIDSSFMKQAGISPGDIVEIQGKKRTVSIADRAYPGDLGLNIIRMDGLIRRNASTSISEFVTVQKADVSEAKKISIAPASKGVVVKSSSDAPFKRGLMGRAVVAGDIISLGGRRTRRDLMMQPPFQELFTRPDIQGSFFPIFQGIKFMVTSTNPSNKPVRITENTLITLNPEAVEFNEKDLIEISYEDIGGLNEEISKIREMVELPLKHPEVFEKLGIDAPRGVLLHGPPGTGKTLLAKAVANETNCHFININGPEIMSKYYGQSEANLRKKFEEAEKNAPSIIFIDEIDAIATKREETRGEVEKRVIAQLLSLMDGLKDRGQVVVIAASNMPNSLDPALRRPGRFDREVEIGVPDKEGRLNVLKIHTRNMPLAKNVSLKDIAAITHGFVGADLAALSKEAAMIVLRRILPDLDLDKDKTLPKEVLDKIKITQEDFKESLKVVKPSAMREFLVDIPNVGWKDIGGLKDIKQELDEAVKWPLKYASVFDKMGIKPPKGVLLYGPPGTGKTMLAKAVANESESNFILVNGPSLLSMWVGESERGVRKVFAKARQTSPTIIFFDEIDSLAPRRGMSADSHVTERLVNQLLTEIDGLQELHDVVIIAATNRPDILDSALLRPGRFDRIIYVSPPDEDARLEIIKVHTKDMPLDKDVKIKEIVKKLDNYVGADIESVVREAAMLALRENIRSKKVKNKHFEEAIKKVRPSTTKEINEAYRSLQEHFKSGQAEQVKEERPVYMG